MKRLLAIIVSVFSLASGFAQTIGIIECNGRTSVSAWEEPGSIIVIDQLSCGQKLPVQGVEKGYIKVQIRGYFFAYVPAEHIRILETDRMPEAAIQELEIEAESVDRRVPDASKSTDPVPLSTDLAILPLTQMDREDVLKSGIEIGLDSSYIKYEEPEFMEETGLTLSLYGNYTVRPKDFMVRFDGRLGFGSVDYTSPISGTADGLRDYIMEGRLLGGRTFEVSGTWYLTPFSGLGYRYLSDGLGDKITSVGHLGYDRRSHYLYSPIGLESSNYLKYGWSLVAVAEYDFFWHGWQHSDLGVPLGSDFTIINDQEDGWGLRASGKIIKETGRYDVVFGPYFKYWNIEDSNEASRSYDGGKITVIEPANTSVEIGGMFGVIF